MASPKHYAAFRVAKTDSALATNLVVTAPSVNNGLFVSKIAGRVDSTIATGTYYVQFLNASSLPSNGTVDHVLAPTKIQHTTGYDSRFDFDITDDFVKVSKGLVVVLSSTEFTLTIHGTAGLSLTVLYK